MIRFHLDKQSVKRYVVYVQPWLILLIGIALQALWGIDPLILDI